MVCSFLWLNVICLFFVTVRANPVAQENKTITTSFSVYTVRLPYNFRIVHSYFAITIVVSNIRYYWSRIRNIFVLGKIGLQRHSAMNIGAYRFTDHITCISVTRHVQNNNKIPSSVVMLLFIKRLACVGGALWAGDSFNIEIRHPKQPKTPISQKFLIPCHISQLPYFL